MPLLATSYEGYMPVIMGMCALIALMPATIGLLVSRLALRKRSLPTAICSLCCIAAP